MNTEINLKRYCKAVINQNLPKIKEIDKKIQQLKVDFLLLPAKTPEIKKEMVKELNLLKEEKKKYYDLLSSAEIISCRLLGLEIRNDLST